MKRRPPLLSSVLALTLLACSQAPEEPTIATQAAAISTANERIAKERAPAPVALAAPSESGASCRPPAPEEAAADAAKALPGTAASAFNGDAKMATDDASRSAREASKATYRAELAAEEALRANVARPIAEQVHEQRAAAAAIADEATFRKALARERAALDARPESERQAAYGDLKARYVGGVP